MRANDVILHSKIAIKKAIVSKIFFLFLAALFLTCCKDPITELKENIFSAQDNALAENEYNSTIEALTDWAANTKFYKKGEKILPPSVIVTFIDSTFLDMDAIEGTLDFGKRGRHKPYGLLCKDGKYRAGKIHFRLNKPVEFPGAVFQLSCDKIDSFYSGSGDAMNFITGNFTVENNNGMSLIVKADQITLTDAAGLTIFWNCNRSIQLIKDAGKGIWGDVYSMEGSASGVNRNGEKFEVTIEKPLVKKMETGCSKTFIKGLLTIKNETSDKTITLNYDPHDNEACDLIAEADINGKKTIFKLE